MARGGKVGCKRKIRNKIRLEKKGSDESDEDYKVDEDEEFDESEDKYCSSLAEDETEEESLDEFEADLEQDWVEKKVKKVRRSKGRKAILGSKKNRIARQRKRKRKVAYNDEDDDDDDDENDNDGDYDVVEERKRNKLFHGEDEYDDGEFWYRQEDYLRNKKPRKNPRVSRTEMYGDGKIKKPRKKIKVSYQEEDEDVDYDCSDDDDDEEFTPDEIDGLDDEEELHVSKKNKVVKPRMRRTQIVKGHRRTRNASNTLKRTKRKNHVKEQDVRQKHRSNLRVDKHAPCKKKKRTFPGKGRKNWKPIADSDSDFVSSMSSDYEYTISEEEREQIREATEFCNRLTNNSRSSGSLKKIKKEKTVAPQKKLPERKGKEKVADMKIEVIGKQVCGICLSEEGKRTVRGVLNCCSHYFCLACIMEWSKVESRCPLCKQRFATITRPAQADGRHDFRDVVISVPERDQVYQPSEEELRGYLDPYENVLCTECNLGGDDALMLLCDICDSPAHTYCVNLGREVPDGNWYCEGCRQGALASANSQAPNPTSGFGATTDMSVSSPPAAPTVREAFDLNEMYVPETPSPQVTVPSPSPRHSIEDSQPLSPGYSANTVSARRQRQQYIIQAFNRSRQIERRNNSASLSNISLFGSQIARNGMTAQEQSVMPVGVTPQSIYDQGRSTPSLYRREVLSPRVNSLREQALLNQASTSMNFSFLGASSRESAGTSASFGGGFVHQQLHPCDSTYQTAAEARALPYQFREVSHSSLEKEQVQSMVRSHLESLSRNFQLGYSTFKDIARTSTHTILAAYGLEHRRNEVHPVRARPLVCDHYEETNQIGGQCSSCFERFLKNVVREIMYIHHRLPSRS